MLYDNLTKPDTDYFYENFNNIDNSNNQLVILDADYDTDNIPFSRPDSTFTYYEHYQQPELNIENINNQQFVINEVTSSDINKDQLLNIAVMGKMGVGKSSLLTCLTNKIFNSGTNTSGITKHPERSFFNYLYDDSFRTVSFLDNPGFDDDENKAIKLLSEIVNSMTSPIDIFIYVIKITRLTKSDRSVLNYIRNKFGQEFSKRCIIVFTHLDHYYNDYIHKQSIISNRPVNELFLDPDVHESFSATQWFIDNESDIGNFVRKHCNGVFFACTNNIIISHNSYYDYFINKIKHFLFTIVHERINNTMWDYIIKTVKTDFYDVKAQLMDKVEQVSNMDNMNIVERIFNFVKLNKKIEGVNYHDILQKYIKMYHPETFKFKPYLVKQNEDFHLNDPYSIEKQIFEIECKFQNLNAGSQLIKLHEQLENFKRSQRTC
jgi:GTP-binding protein EngB required for normal cell division